MHSHLQPCLKRGLACIVAGGLRHSRSMMCCSSPAALPEGCHILQCLLHSMPDAC